MWVTEACVDVRAPALNIVSMGNRLQLRLIAAQQNRVRHKDRAIFEHNATLFSDSKDGAYQVLIEAHASSDAVHENANLALVHACYKLPSLVSTESYHRRRIGLEEDTASVRTSSLADGLIFEISTKLNGPARNDARRTV